MKKFAILILSAICLTACQESNEEKAEKLIKKAFNAMIVNIETYEPIETIVDSAFAPMHTVESFERIANLPAQYRMYTKLMSDVERSKRAMSIYENPYSSYGKEQYKQAKEEYETASKDLKTMEAKMKADYEEMGKMPEAEPVFNGYIVNHKYRYVSKEGEKTIGEHVFLMNKDFTKIEAMLDLQDEELKAIIEDSNNQSFLR